MSKLRRWGLTVVTMVSVATVVLLVTGWGSAVAASVSSVIVANPASNPANVKVTNTTPLSVQESNTDTNGNIKVHEQGTANVNVTNTSVPVHDTNTDTNGNIKVHEQGIANVNVTGTPTVQTEGATVIANGFIHVPANGVQNLSGGTESGDSRFTDVSAYREVTLYLREGCGTGDVGSTDVAAFTGNPQTGFLLVQQFDDIVPTSEFTTHTFSPAPATIWLEYANNSTEQCALEYVLVGRNN